MVCGQRVASLRGPSRAGSANHRYLCTGGIVENRHARGNEFRGVRKIRFDSRPGARNVIDRLGPQEVLVIV